MDPFCHVWFLLSIYPRIIDWLIVWSTLYIYMYVGQECLNKMMLIHLFRPSCCSCQLHVSTNLHIICVFNKTYYLSDLCDLYFWCMLKKYFHHEHFSVKSILECHCYICICALLFKMSNRNFYVFMSSLIVIYISTLTVKRNKDN